MGGLEFLQEEEANLTLSAIALFVAIVGGLLLVIPGLDEYRRRLGLSFFVVGLGTTALLFLIGNPDILRDLRDHTALTLIGMVVAGLSIIRTLRK